MAWITPPPPAPQRGVRSTFADRFDAFITWIIGFIAELVALVGNLNALAAGGAYSIPYTFTAITANIGKGGFFTSPNNGFVYFDLKDARGSSVATLLASMVASSTSVTKGQLRIQKLGDPNAWIVMSVSSYTAQDANSAVAAVGVVGSAGAILEGDPVMMFFQRTGDKGDAGASAISLLAATKITSAVANIDFLGIFNSGYDAYVIELGGITPSAADLLSLRMAVAGAVDAGNVYTTGSNSGAALTLQSSVGMGSACLQMSATIKIRNPNGLATAKSLNVGATWYDSTSTYRGSVSEFVYGSGNAITGFRLFWGAGANFTGGTIRVYGLRNA